MIGISASHSRFSLLILEENEQYLKDFICYITLANPSNPKITIQQEKGKIFVCSRTLVVELQNTNNMPASLFKYRFQDMKAAPMLNQKRQLELTTNHVIEIPGGDPAKPYFHYSTQTYRLAFIPLYAKREVLQATIRSIYHLTMKNKNRFNYELDLQNSMFLNDQFFGSTHFDKTRIRSLTEKTLLTKELPVKQILPMITIDGLFFLTNQRLYFQPYQNIYEEPVVSYKIADIVQLFKRRYKLMRIGIEITTAHKSRGSKSLFLAFKTVIDAESVYSSLLSLVDPTCETESSIHDYANLWIEGKLSNYDYLMHLNSASMRTFADITQYPVYPWVIADYSSEVLDLKDPAIYRDLSKPIGALNPKRLEEFQLRYQHMPEPKFLYGTHYSAPGYVIGYLIRRNPEFMLKMHGGRFDKPDRLFKSIKKQWNSAMTNPGNVKELIPEFYQNDASFLINSKKLDLGVRQNGKRVEDVKMPKWANDAQDFLKINREALESHHVSMHLHEWIDLIFGYKQKGPAAQEALNLFHPYTYEGAINIESKSDPVERNAIELQINQFGQTPRQLFTHPHPQKFSNSFFKFADNLEPQKQEVKPQLDEEEKQISPQTPLVIEASESLLSITRDYKEESWLKSLGSCTFINNSHKKEVTGLLVLEEHLLSTSRDGNMKLFNLVHKKHELLRQYNVCSLGISCVCRVSSSPNIVALGSYDKKIYIRNCLTGTSHLTFDAHSDTVSALSFGGNRLISASTDCTVKIWQFDEFGGLNTATPQILCDHDDLVISSDLLADNLLVTLDMSGKVVWRDLRMSPANLISQFTTSEPESQTPLLLVNRNNFGQAFLSGCNSKIQHLDFEGGVIESFEFKDDPSCFMQNQDCFFLGFAGEGVEIFNWRDDQQVLDSQSLGFSTSVLCTSLGYSELDRPVVVIGGMNGELAVVNRSTKSSNL